MQFVHFLLGSCQPYLQWFQMGRMVCLLHLHVLLRILLYSTDHIHYANNFSFFLWISCIGNSLIPVDWGIMFSWILFILRQLVILYFTRIMICFFFKLNIISTAVNGDGFCSLLKYVLVYGLLHYVWAYPIFF